MFWWVLGYSAALITCGWVVGYCHGRDVEDRRWRDHIARVTERTIDEGLARLRDTLRGGPGET